MINNQEKVIRIHPKDNVLVALINLKNGDTIDFENKSDVLKKDIAAKHKFTIRKIDKGGLVYMYGVIVGRAIKKISEGCIIDSNNFSENPL